jgi:hypothetical protein
MKPLPYNDDLLSVAPRVIWFETPEKALANPLRFLAYVMTYGTPQDVAIVRRYVDDDGFREAVDYAPPGIMDARSWAYWNTMAGRLEMPLMPKRRLPE